jgi:protoporphyrinogen oxidase
VRPPDFEPRAASSPGAAWDAIILGAGVTGLVAASVLHRQGLKRVLVIDEYDRLGGNHIHRHIGPYTFDIGPQIFQDDSPLMAHFSELLAIYHPVTIDISRIAPGGDVRAYPFSLREDVVSAGPVEWIRLLASLAWARVPPVRIANAADYARYWIGPRVFDRSGLAHYIERFYGAKASEIDKVFAEKRMPRIADAASLRKRIAKLLGAKES